MRRTAVLAAGLLVFAAPAAAQQDGQGPGPGLVGAGSPLYGLEVAMDNAAVSIGLARAGGVAQERAAEAQQAAENGDARGVERAARAMDGVAKKARSGDEAGLQRAESVLQEAMADAPQEAQQGLQTALDSVRSAQTRARQDPDGTEGDDGGTPDSGDRPGRAPPGQ